MEEYFSSRAGGSKTATQKLDSSDRPYWQTVSNVAFNANVSLFLRLFVSYIVLNGLSHKLNQETIGKRVNRPYTQVNPSSVIFRHGTQFFRGCYSRDAWTAKATFSQLAETKWRETMRWRMSSHFFRF